MADPRRLLFWSILALFSGPSAARQLHSRHPHTGKTLHVKNHAQKAWIAPKSHASEADHAKSHSSAKAEPLKAAKTEDKAQQEPVIPFEDLMRGRAAVQLPADQSYAQIQPKKSLIGAIVIFALYFLGAMVYNYIRKLTEQDRVDQALREYEEEREHYIETGETIDVSGSGV
ncbi:uncharacterized protein BcabD6B2_47560 [Babesia caballi]|uniref:Membrane protein, putative n=1 Tax=Babesia caballi TaxID=5871 RepID=A0AAV4M1R5_BABCB|nr:membrane protein, putative [Babesia caballi]